MIITRSPLRITLGGGGTDIPSYYQRYGGFLIAAAIDKYVYITISRPFVPGIFLKYSKIENVNDIHSVKHSIIREALKMMNFKNPQIEISSIADIPAGTGLGSSGSFTTALIKALYTYRKRLLHPSDLAKLACEIEIDRLHEPIGKQDQYIASYGGITCFNFHENGDVDTKPLTISTETLFEIEDNLLLFFTGFVRNASDLLKDQVIRSRENDHEMLQNLHDVKEMGFRSLRALESGHVSTFGELMHNQWEYKKKRTSGMSNSKIDEWYELGRTHGALGGKLVGAGGGGFLLFYAEDHRRLRKAMTHAGLEEVRFRFDFEGTKVLLA